MNELELAFTERMLGVYEEAKSECGYIATRFRQMVLDQGGVQAAKTLLRARHSDGLTSLWEAERLDISMEATVLQEPWCGLFTPEELGMALSHLRALGYEPEVMGSG